MGEEGEGKTGEIASPSWERSAHEIGLTHSDWRKVGRGIAFCRREGRRRLGCWEGASSPPPCAGPARPWGAGGFHSRRSPRRLLCHTGTEKAGGPALCSGERSFSRATLIRSCEERRAAAIVSAAA